MRKRQYAHKPASNVSAVTANHLLQTRPFQPGTTTDQQTSQLSEEPDRSTGGFDLTKTQLSFAQPTPNIGQPLQAKLTIGEPNDKYEQEADRVAHDVVQRINDPLAQQPPVNTHKQNDSSVQRKNADFQQPLIQPKLFSGLIPGINRFTARVQQDSVEHGSDVVSGAVPNQFESELNRAKGGGQSLQPELRTKLEGAMGADFSRVKVHTNSQADQLNHSIQAKAFTTGRDIFFRQGAYTPNSSSGQELIAHELTHTIQQKAVPSSTANQQITASTNAVNAAMLQRKTVVINDKAHDRLVQGGLAGAPKEQLKKIEKGKQQNVYNKGDFVDISDNDADHIKDETGKNIAWYRVDGSTSLYIRASKVFNVDVSAKTTSQGTEGEKLLEGFNEQVVDTTGSSVEDFSQEIQETAKENNLEANTADLDIAKGSFDLVGGIMGMAISIKDLVSNNERGFTDWIATLWNSVASLGKTTSGISSIVSNASESTSKTAKDSKQVADWSSSVSGAMSALGEGIKTIKSVADLIKMVASDEKYSTNEYAKQGSEIIASALGTAKGVVESVKSFIEIFEGPVGGLADAVPGLDIAISATQTIVQGYYLAVSAHHWREMSRSSQEITGNLEASGKSKLETEQAKKTYQQKRAGIINLESRRSEKEAKNANRKKTLDELETKKIALEKEKQDLQTEKKGKPDKKRMTAIDKRITAIDEELNGTFFSKGINAKIDELKEMMRVTQGKIENSEDRIGALKKEITDYESNSGIKQVDLEELELSDELVSGNRKRVVRQAIHISTNAAKIAGGIANLTGVGATVGVTLKASAAGVDISLPFVRAIKQYGRDVAARNQAKGESGIANKIFNADKSTLAKLEDRKKHTIVILKMVNNLNTYLPLPTVDLVARNQKTVELRNNAYRVEKFISASGCEPKALYRANDKPEQQAKMLVEALYKREF